ncbi:hypothetical protein AVEN_48783-1 [Araneus ventricosus]|uniref:Uncharacterized protein n=1 Tax=Araneus ventricosus TaxID=182803 RepID=A0A4Y2LRK7_ARAVE|nr:hypothetical protein AVEN_48783-1 [Araneus ventricosus]
MGRTCRKFAADLHCKLIANHSKNRVRTQPGIELATYRQTPSPIPCFSPVSLDTLQQNSPTQAFNISIPEVADCQSPYQRVPSRLRRETSDLDNAMADWSLHHHENDTDDLEILFSKIQNPSGLMDFSSSPTHISEISKLQGPPDKECSLEQLLQKLREVLSTLSPSAARAFSL